MHDTQPKPISRNSRLTESTSEPRRDQPLSNPRGKIERGFRYVQLDFLTELGADDRPQRAPDKAAP